MQAGHSNLPIEAGHADVVIAMTADELFELIKQEKAVESPTKLLTESPTRKRSLIKQNSIYQTPKTQSKTVTLHEVASFLNGVMRKKVAIDAKFGLDPARKISFNAFTFQEFIALGFGEFNSGR